MYDILFSPLQAISAAKVERRIMKSMIVVLVASLLAGMGALIASQDFSARGALVFLIVVVGSFVGTVVLSVLFQLALRVLSGRGSFYEAITVIGYSFFITTAAFFVASTLKLIPFVGLWLGGILMGVAVILSTVVMLRAGMELFSTDLLSVLIALFAVYVGIFMAIYFIAIGLILENLATLTGLARVGAGVPGLSPFG